MSGSLKEELLRLGIAKPKAEEPKQRRRDRRGPRSGEPSARPSGDQPARRVQDGHSDAASSRPPRHARDAQASAPPPIQKRNETADARAKDREREARMARLRERIEAHKLDDPQAEIRQYYSTGKKIKRIYVTEAQAAALLRGEIVIVVAQGKGRLVASVVLPELRAIDPELRVVDPGSATEAEDDGVPDDLRW